MSTMYDALRKAEAERKKSAGPSSTPALGDHSDESKINSIKAGVLLIAVIVVFTIAFFRIKGLMQEAKKSVVVHSTLSAQTPEGVQAVKPQMEPYVLDGIIDAGVNSMAIINGKLLKPEDTTGDLVLKKISSKEVELLNAKDNSTVILKIK